MEESFLMLILSQFIFKRSKIEVFILISSHFTVEETPCWRWKRDSLTEKAVCALDIATQPKPQFTDKDAKMDSVICVPDIGIKD